MSKEVYGVKNQEKFNVAMVVGHVLNLRTGASWIINIVEDWCYDAEISDFACYIYEIVKGADLSNEKIIQLIRNCLKSGFDINSIPSAETDEDYTDFWYGVECGDFFGVPNEESLKKSDKALRLFKEQKQYGFVHEVILKNDLA